MSYNRPTNEPPDWTPPDADVVEPTGGEKATGWQGTDIPSAEVFNWFWRNGSRWVLHLRDVAARYLTLYSAGDDPDLGDKSTYLLYDDDNTNAPGSVMTSLPTGTTAYTGIAVTSRHVILPHNGGSFLRVYNIETAAVVEVALSGSGVPTAVATDGLVLMVGRGNDALLYDVSDADPNNWSLIATCAHGAVVHDVAVGANGVYLVGAAGTGTHHARGFTRAGASDWSYDHGGILYHCCTDGQYLFVAGAASSYASAATLRALDASNGNDATNEGGTAASTTIRCWNDGASNVSVPTTSGGALACDRSSLYVADTSAGEVQFRSKATDLKLFAHAFSGVDAVAVDQDAVFAVTAAEARAIDRRTGSGIWARIDYASVAGVATNGSRLYLFGGTAAVRTSRGNTPTWYMKGPSNYAAPLTGQHLPFSNS